MSPTRCPSRDELADYNSGKLPEDALNSVANHVEECPSCQTTLQSLLAAEDTVELGLRRVSGATAEPPHPAFQRAMAQTRQKLAESVQRELQLNFDKDEVLALLQGSLGAPCTDHLLGPG